MIDEALATVARAWVAADPDPVDRAELAALLGAAEAGDHDAVDELADRFGGRLRFGTAGLRAAMGAGPMRMNRAVVRQAAAGLARVLGGPGTSVVIAYDARHRSEDFARDTAGVVAAAGCRALLLPAAAPTPVLAFAVRHLGADAGVMCTASHNPAGDNGYKVYLGDGAQIVPPVDAQIAAAIDTVAAEVAEGRPVPLAPDDDLRVVHLGEEVTEAYAAHVAGLVPAGPRDLRIVYTPLHGVGGRLARSLLAGAGFADVVPVPEQLEPDPEFPTVAYPNPEEPGALDLAIDLAGSVGAQLVLANDPDADRLGVAVPLPAGEAGGDGEADRGRARWRVLSGNEVGALLADHILTAGDEARAGEVPGDRLVVTSFVSSRLVPRLAERHGVHHAEVLTGFKWIVRPAMAHPEQRFVLGFEEALGYSIDPYVRDKDGLAAALAVADLVARLADEGRTVWDRLHDLAVELGHHAGRTWSVRIEGRGAAELLRAATDRWRTAPPTELAGRAVRSFVDLAEGGALPPTDALVAELDGGARVIVRPSGTEAKLKCYLEVVVPLADRSACAWVAARQEGERRLEALRLSVAADLGLAP